MNFRSNELRFNVPSSVVDTYSTVYEVVVDTVYSVYSYDTGNTTTEQYISIIIIFILYTRNIPAFRGILLLLYST